MKKPQNILLTFCFLAIVSIGYAGSPMEGTSGANDQMLVTNTKLAWDAFKNKDAKAFDAVIAADIVDIEANGSIFIGPQIHQRMMACNLSNVSLTDFKVYWIDAEAGFITYKATYSGSCGAETFSNTQVVASDLWVKKDGKWWAKFHQETPVAPPPAAKQ